MAELAPSKKYFTLSNVRLAHRAKDDTFHLTAQDEDFPEGFHMTLSGGSNLETRIRDLFEEQGLLKPKARSTKSNPLPRPKALFIGTPAVGEALVTLRRDWDFLPSVRTISELWAGLSAGSITNDVQFMLIQDSEFDPAGKDQSFETLAATMSPHCLFGIVNYEPRFQELIRNAIEAKFYDNGVPTSTPYFFIDPQSPNRTINEALETFNEPAALPLDLA